MSDVGERDLDADPDAESCWTSQDVDILHSSSQCVISGQPVLLPSRISSRTS